MGQNLSLQEPFADTSGVVWSAIDREAFLFLGLFWLGSLYGIAMIACACSLLKRWSGKHGERGTSFLSVLAAFLLATGWPVIFAYFLLQKRS